MHKLNIVHGNLRIVCSPIPHVGRSLTSVQTNILIDSGGRAYIAGLGTALLPSALPGVDIDRFSHGTAPELVDPRRLGLTDAKTTEASDVYSFGVLAWEVSPMFSFSWTRHLRGGFPLRFLPGGLHSPTKEGLQEFTQC